jgi:hypothetical protein
MGKRALFVAVLLPWSSAFVVPVIAKALLTHYRFF